MQSSDQIAGQRRLRTAAIGLAIVVAASAVVYWRWIHFARPPAPELSGTFSRERLLVGGRERSFGVYVPATLSKPTPLVVALHGSGETGAEFRWHTGYDFDRLADEHGFVVAYPDGFERHWDDCRAAATYTARTDHVDDVAFIHALIQRLHQTVGITDGVVFAVGHSNGAQMAYRLALELPDEITAVAAISAGLPAADNLDCRPRGAPISVLIMNGTADPLNPYEGGRMTIFGFGNRGNIRSTADTARYFVELDDLPPAPVLVERLEGGNDSLWVERSTWSSPRHVTVQLDTIHGGGHVVPEPWSRYPRVLGRTVPGFDGPAEIWHFFAWQLAVE